MLVEFPTKEDLELFEKFAKKYNLTFTPMHTKDLFLVSIVEDIHYNKISLLNQKFDFTQYF